jgi:hypothetical protein
MSVLQLCSGTHTRSHTTRHARLAPTGGGEQWRCCDGQHKPAHCSDTSSTHPPKPWQSLARGGTTPLLQYCHCDLLRSTVSLTTFYFSHPLSSGRGTYVVA